MTAQPNLPATAANAPAIKPLTDKQLNAQLAQYGVSLKPAPGEGKWAEGWLPGDDPVEVTLEDDGAPTGPCANYGPVHATIHPAAVFDAPARVRFLDELAMHGNVRAAAARVGVSRETVYRARRRHADFARLWDAALVHARAAAETELATRAFDGVAVPVFLRGEHVATWRKHDARYLLAHLARLDRRIEENPDAVKRAECFDTQLAAMLGHEAPDDFDDARAMAAECGAEEPDDLPPSREAYRLHARDAAMMEEPEADLSEDEIDALEAEEARAMASADIAAGEAWDAWEAAGQALLDRVLAGGPDEGVESVTCVNTPEDETAPVTPAQAGVQSEGTESDDGSSGSPPLRG